MQSTPVKVAENLLSGPVADATLPTVLQMQLLQPLAAHVPHQDTF